MCLTQVCLSRGAATLPVYGNPVLYATVILSGSSPGARVSRKKQFIPPIAEVLEGGFEMPPEEALGCLWAILCPETLLWQLTLEETTLEMDDASNGVLRCVPLAALTGIILREDTFLTHSCDLVQACSE